MEYFRGGNKMKRIDLGKGYAIDIDSLNMTLKKDVRVQKSKTTGEEYEACNVVGYYSSLEAILNAYYKEKVIEHLEDKQTLKMALNVLKETKEMVKKQFEGLDFK
jgi:hypothetical protein